MSGNLRKPDIARECALIRKGSRPILQRISADFSGFPYQFTRNCSSCELKFLRSSQCIPTVQYWTTTLHGDVAWTLSV